MRAKLILVWAGPGRVPFAADAIENWCSAPSDDELSKQWNGGSLLGLGTAEGEERLRRDRERSVFGKVQGLPPCTMANSVKKTLG
jgi:hypothetical protein